MSLNGCTGNIFFLFKKNFTNIFVTDRLCGRPPHHTLAHNDHRRGSSRALVSKRSSGEARDVTRLEPQVCFSFLSFFLTKITTVYGRRPSQTATPLRHLGHVNNNNDTTPTYLNISKLYSTSTSINFTIK